MSKCLIYSVYVRSTYTDNEYVLAVCVALTPDCTKDRIK